jgi:hypothetical protein
MTTRDAGLTQEQVEAAEVHAAGSSHCGEIKSKSAFSRYSTVPVPVVASEYASASCSAPRRRRSVSSAVAAAPCLRDTDTDTVDMDMADGANPVHAVDINSILECEKWL